MEMNARTMSEVRQAQAAQRAADSNVRRAPNMVQLTRDAQIALRDAEENFGKRAAPSPVDDLSTPVIEALWRSGTRTPQELRLLNAGPGLLAREQKSYAGHGVVEYMGDLDGWMLPFKPPMCATSKIAPYGSAAFESMQTYLRSFAPEKLK